jgi:hypothetical protein
LTNIEGRHPDRAGREPEQSIPPPREPAPHVESGGGSSISPRRWAVAGGHGVGEALACRSPGVSRGTRAAPESIRPIGAVVGLLQRFEFVLELFFGPRLGS